MNGAAEANGCIFRSTEIRAIYSWFTPEYIVPAAREHGFGDPVVGALAAFQEARQMTKDYVRYIVARARRRGPQGGETAQDLNKRIKEDVRFISWVMEMGKDVQPLTTLPDPRGYRRLMIEAHPSWQPWQIQGYSPRFRVNTCSQGQLFLATVRAVGEMLTQSPHLNRALLPPFSAPRIWQRLTPHVTTSVVFGGDDLSVLVLDPRVENPRMHMRRQLRSLMQVRKHWLWPWGQELLASWMRHGFIASYSGAFISDASGLKIGEAQPVFLAGTGVPISIAVQPVVDGWTRLGIAVDHRVFDGPDGAQMHEFLAGRVEELLR